MAFAAGQSGTGQKHLGTPGSVLLPPFRLQRGGLVGSAAGGGGGGGTESVASSAALLLCGSDCLDSMRRSPSSGVPRILIHSCFWTQVELAHTDLHCPWVVSICEISS